MFSKLLSSAFETPLPNPKITLIQNLKRTHAGVQSVSICECSAYSFPLDEYLESLNITEHVEEGETHKIIEYDHGSRSVSTSTVAGVSRFTYESTEYVVYKATWDVSEWKTNFFYHLVFSSQDDAPGKKLTAAVYQWAQSPKEEVWIYENESWDKSKSLYKSIRAADWESVIMKDDFREGLRRDIETFFDSRETYNSLNITWKRGILLLGPPGNGKTESIKALLNEFKHVEALYVKTFTTRYGPERGVRSIFKHAREHVPCILVIEDLDSMVTNEVRSFFLNELDGLARNEGILTIATTNHPERIDDAILNRPSRFDVKYEFALPDHDLRRAFALRWLKKVQSLGNNSGIVFEDPEETATLVADKTDSWSFAFLKELFVSFMLKVVHDKTRSERNRVEYSIKGDFETLLLDQADNLANQIIKREGPEVPEPEETPKKARGCC